MTPLLSITAAAFVLTMAVFLTLAMPRDERQSPGVAGNTRIGQEAKGATVLRPLDLATDSRVRECPGAADATNVLAAVELTRGVDYRKAFPKMGRSPELETLATPVAMVVYSGGYRGAMWGAPDGGPREDRRPEPGTVDICAVMSSTERVVYLDVPLEGFMAP